MAPFPWPLAAVPVALPHAYYFVIWTRPALWIQFCKNALKKDPWEVMYQVSLAGKLLQFSTFAGWYFTAAPAITMSEILSFSLLRLLFALVAVVLGLALNRAAFKAIGKEGIFYGCKLGRKIPWCTTWPFGGPYSMRHPQYLGSCLLLVGGATLIATTQHIQAGMVWLILSWVACYVAAGTWEDYL